MTDLRSRDDLTGSVRARRGAHRAAPSRLLGLVPVLLVVAAVGVLAAGVALLTGFGGGATSPRDTAATVAASSVSTPEPTSAEPAEPAAAPAPAPSGDGEGEPAPSAGAEEPADAASDAAPSAAPVPSAPEEPAAAEEDVTEVPLVVLNATRTSGLAAATARTLEREGWTVASTGNERGDAVEATVVRYPDADLEAAALAVAATLGGDVEVVLDDDAEADAVTVVAGPDQDR